MRSTTPVIVLLLLVAPGCVHATTNEIETAMEPASEGPPAAAGELREIVVASEDSDQEGAESVSSGLPALPARAAALTPAHPAMADPALFRLGAGYGVLGHVDLAPCREQGLPAGYLHMRVTFRQSGRVVRAAVETAVAPPSEALACISEQLEMAMVPLFEGGDVTLSRSFFVN